MTEAVSKRHVGLRAQTVSYITCLRTVSRATKPERDPTLELPHLPLLSGNAADSSRPLSVPKIVCMLCMERGLGRCSVLGMWNAV